MKIKDYFKERLPFLVINLCMFVSIIVLMVMLKVGSGIIFLVFIIWFGPLVVYMIMECVKYKQYYDEIEELLENLDKKYLLPEVIERPEFLEGQFLYDIIQICNKDMHEHINFYKNLELEYREYIETWVHEIKTPIASTRLIIENNSNTITNNINQEIKKIEEFIEQVLYYSRSNNVSKDYIIKEISLKTTVMNAVKRNSRDFINKKIILCLEEIEGTVYSDAKWVEFILNQILGNSIKYSKNNNAKITIYSVKNENNIVLNIEDNGIGIIDKDINKIFEKGFTGENGRKYGKSTGIGLYLCKKLCNKLGLGIELTSKENEGTKVSIIFPRGKNTSLESI